jgi:hypothetical protein
MDPNEAAIELVVARIDEDQLTELADGGDENVEEPLRGAKRRRERMERLLADSAPDDITGDPLPYAWDYLQRRISFLENEVRLLKEQQEETEARTPERRDANQRLQEARRILKHTRKLAQDPMFDRVRDA